jgi:hypothetical protein
VCVRCECLCLYCVIHKKTSNYGPCNPNNGHLNLPSFAEKDGYYVNVLNLVKIFCLQNRTSVLSKKKTGTSEVGILSRMTNVPFVGAHLKTDFMRLLAAHRLKASVRPCERIGLFLRRGPASIHWSRLVPPPIGQMPGRARRLLTLIFWQAWTRHNNILHNVPCTCQRLIFFLSR